MESSCGVRTVLSPLRAPVRSAAAIVAVMAAGCGGQQPYSSPISTSAATTFDCARGQLVQMGYSIETADREKGIVIGSRGLVEAGAGRSALVLEAEVDAVDSGSKLSVKPYRSTESAAGDIDRSSDSTAEADARQLLVRCGGRVDQGEPDRPYGVRPEITTTP
ncbi:MAG: hypothetical protein M8862_08555 [marine benthic group bacterium]|jgi:hypothetical protein|nr:hypothetical protein [Gemmatimonadota bacterium]